MSAALWAYSHQSHLAVADIQEDVVVQTAVQTVGLVSNIARLGSSKGSSKSVVNQQDAQGIAASEDEYANEDCERQSRDNLENGSNGNQSSISGIGATCELGSESSTEKNAFRSSPSRQPQSVRSKIRNSLLLYKGERSLID